MYANVFATGMVTEISEVNPDTKITYIQMKVLQTITQDSQPKTIWANVILKMLEGYEKYTGHVELGDILSVEGRFVVSQNGGPIFSDNDGLPHFVIIPHSTAVLAHGGEQTGMDKFTVIALGNLGRDPEMRFTPNGAAVTNANIATSRKVPGPKDTKVSETTWFRFSFWGKLAETVNQYLTKGNRILAEGHVQYDPETHGPKTYVKDDKSLGSSFEITGRAMTMINTGGGSADHQPMGNLPDEEPEAQPETPENTKNPAPAEKSKIPF